MQMIFQDPRIVEPRLTVGDIVGEDWTSTGCAGPLRRRDRVYRLLGEVGLDREHAGRFLMSFRRPKAEVGIAGAPAVESGYRV